MIGRIKKERARKRRDDREHSSNVTVFYLRLNIEIWEFTRCHLPRTADIQVRQDVGRRKITEEKSDTDATEKWNCVGTYILMCKNVLE